jgi:hypothetical protein
MAFYFSKAQVPELAALPDGKRLMVRRGATKMFRQEKPPIVFQLVAGSPGLAAIACGFLTYYLLQLFYSGADHTAVAWIGFFVAGAVGSKIGIHIFFVIMRPYFRRYIEGHRDEISRAA